MFSGVYEPCDFTEMGTMYCLTGEAPAVSHLPGRQRAGVDHGVPHPLHKGGRGSPWPGRTPRGPQERPGELITVDWW